MTHVLETGAAVERVSDGTLRFGSSSLTSIEIMSSAGSQIISTLDELRRACRGEGPIVLMKGFGSISIPDDTKEDMCEVIEMMMTYPGIEVPLFKNARQEWRASTDFLSIAELIPSCQGYRMCGAWKAEEIGASERVAMVWFARD